MPASSPRVANVVGRKRKRSNSDADFIESSMVDFGRSSPVLALDDATGSESAPTQARESFFMRNKILTWPVLSSGVFAGVFTGLISIPALHAAMSTVSGWVLSVLPAAISSKAFTAAVGAAIAGSLVGLVVGAAALVAYGLYKICCTSKSKALAQMRQPLVEEQNSGKPTVVAPVKLTLEGGGDIANPTSYI